MNTKWNLAAVRKIAGIPLTEAWHDDNDDDEDPDVKVATSDKRQKEFESRNKKHLDDNAAMLKKRTADQKAAADKKKDEKKADQPKAEESSKTDDKPAEEKKADQPKAEEKAAEQAAEAKRRGAKPNANSKAQRAAAWINANKSGTRGQFLAWAKANLDMGAAYGSAFFARHNPKSKRQPAGEQKNEAFVLTHPFMPSFLLAENREMNQMQWVDPSSNLEPLVFETKDDATKIATYMSEWRGQQSTIVRVVFED